MRRVSLRSTSRDTHLTTAKVTSMLIGRLYNITSTPIWRSPTIIELMPYSLLKPPTLPPLLLLLQNRPSDLSQSPVDVHPSSNCPAWP